MSVATQSQPGAPAGIKSYYQAKIEAAEIEINQKTQNLRRLEAQRNALNARGASPQSHILSALHLLPAQSGSSVKSSSCFMNLAATSAK
jgi:hypothetical protein